MAKKVKHVGFKGAMASVEKEGYGKQAAGAIIASAGRKASAKAKKVNPKLMKISGNKK